MKRFAVGMLLVMTCLSMKAMEEENGIEHGTIVELYKFTAVKKGEDVSALEDLALRAFPALGKDDEHKARIAESVKKQFATLVSWLGTRGKELIRAENSKNELVGFVALEAVDEGGSRIIVNMSPLDGGRHHLTQLTHCLRQFFPQAVAVYSYGRSNAAWMKERGWEPVEGFVPNPELIPDSTGWQGFKLTIPRVYHPQMGHQDDCLH